MADFADLVGTSIANAATRSDLQASRDSLRELADSLSVLARQQAALRRVATLVARGVSQSEVFSAVAEEMAGCLITENADVFRYENDGEAILVVASHAAPGMPKFSVGERITSEGDNVSAIVFRRGKAARMDSWGAPSAPLPNAFASWVSGRGSGPRSWWMSECGEWPSSAALNPTRCRRTPRHASPSSPSSWPLRLRPPPPART
jgi:uncharacterized protein YoaH (UPF0181 family)